MDAEDSSLQLRLQTWSPPQQPSPSQDPGPWSDVAAIPVETTLEQPSPSEFHGIWQTGTSHVRDVTALSQQPFPCEASYPTDVLQNGAIPSLPINTFIPQVEEEKIPKVGIIFENIEEAYNAYNLYAKLAGFSIRRSSETRLNNEVVRKNFVCSKEGSRKEKLGVESIVQRRNSDTRADCGAHLQIKKTKEGKWVVFKIIVEHTHLLSTPRKTHMLRSHRIVSAPKKKLIYTYGAANLRPKDQMALLELQAGGRDKVGFTETDFRNQIRNKREETKDQDGEMFFEYFKQVKERDPRCYFAIEKDDDDHIKHVFWADYYFQKSYEEFGDVVSFDTTYNTNRYGLVFGAFTGINHHDQSILFGCCLISNETFDTFVWVFNKWIEAMRRDPPKAILTDQDAAMTKAIKSVFPTTCHRYCLWHIMQNLQKNLGGIAIHNPNFIKQFKRIAYNSITIEHFEMAWKNMLIEFDLVDNEWLHSMYGIREMWVPTYFRDIFFGGMSTTSRSESINAFLKQYVTQKNGLYDFMLRYERGIATQKYRQLKADHDTINGRPRLMTDLQMEKKMSEIYTKKMFYKFQEQFCYITCGIVELIYDDIEQRVYNVSSFKNEQEIERTVLFKKDDKEAKCSCQLFENRGLPCGHIICVFKQEKIYELPQRFILKRWTRFARIDNESDSRDCFSCDGSLLERHGDLSYEAAVVVDEASMCKTAYQYAKKILQELKKNIREINEKEVTAEDDRNGRDKGTCHEERYLAPKNAKTKGRPKRLKSSKEKAMRKPRLCRGCGRRDVAHDMRNCPMLVKSPIVHVSGNDGSILEDEDDDLIECEGLEMAISDDGTLTQI